MGVGLQLLMVLMSVNFLAEASTGDAHYETELFPHKQTNVTVAKMHELLRQYLLNRVPERLLELQESQGPLYTDKFPEPRESQRPLFTYKFPEPRPDETFAVPPSDPRYYYLPPSDRYENQETFERSSKLNRENKSSVRRPYTDVANTPVVNVVPEDRVVPENHPVHPPPEDEISNAEESDERVEVKQPASHHSAFRSSPAATPVSTVQIIKTPVGDFEATREDMIFMATVAGCSAAAVVIIAIVGFGWYRLHRRVKAAADVDYPAYGVTGPNKEISPTGDRKLAENAQMYHYQHQKQQIISMSNNRVSNDQRGSGSEAESDEENEEGDYTVYECPGLAATGEMEVKNPLFQDDPTPAGGPEPVTQPQSNAPPQK